MYVAWASSDLNTSTSVSVLYKPALHVFPESNKKALRLQEKKKNQTLLLFNR
jgi:hypothetical protein